MIRIDSGRAKSSCCVFACERNGAGVSDYSSMREFARTGAASLGFNKDCFRPDLIAGLTTAAVVIPKAMAYATIAGLPVQVGI